MLGGQARRTTYPEPLLTHGDSGETRGGEIYVFCGGETLGELR